MCNASNHAPGCRCGWGGDGHLGRSPGGYRAAPTRAARRRSLPVTRIFDSYTDPNARCPVCGDSVFFYQAPSGGRVFFDELGPPWPKHPCTDNPRIPVALAQPGSGASRRMSPDRRLADWQVEGWTPIQIESSTRANGAHSIRCVTWDGGYREFRVFVEEEVRVNGAAAAAMRSWDEGGRSVISFVELDTGAAPQSIQISRSAPGQARYIIEQLLKVIAIAEAEADVVDIPKVAQRFDELERRMETWAQHLSEEETDAYWTRFRAASTRAANRALTAQRAELAEKESLVSELETLASSSSDWESVSTRFAELLELWRAGGGLGRSGNAALGNRFVAAERAGLAKQAEAKRTRAKIARVAAKEQLIAELNDLAQTTDWPVADLRHQDIKKRWNRTGHFNKGDETLLSEAFREAKSTYVAARARALEKAARRRDARAREARIATKTQLIAALEALPRTADWSAADGRYREIKQQWITAGHFASEGDSELSEAFEEVEAAYLAACDEARAAADRERAILEAEERRAEQERVVAEAESLARAPYWDAVGFEKLSLRWKASGPAFDSALRARFQDAYMIARGPGFKDAIRTRLHLIAEAARLSDLAGWHERALQFAGVADQWAAAAWAGPDIESPLQRRYQTTINAFLVACDVDDLERFLAQAEDARLRAHGSGDRVQVKKVDADLDRLVRLSTAVREVRVPTGDSPAER